MDFKNSNDVYLMLKIFKKLSLDKCLIINLCMDKYLLLHLSKQSNSNVSQVTVLVLV